MSNALTIIMGEEASSNSSKWGDTELIQASPHPVHSPITGMPAIFTGAGYASSYKNPNDVNNGYIQYNSMYQTIDALGGISPSDYTYGSHIIKKISETSVLVVLNYPRATTTKCYMYIATFDQNSPNTVNLGSMVNPWNSTIQVEMRGSYQYTARSPQTSVFLNPTNTGGILWGYDSGGSTKMYAQAFTISGTTIALGAVTAITTATTVDSSQTEVVDVSNGAGTKYMMMAANSSNVGLTVFTVSGTTITVGSTVNTFASLTLGYTACPLDIDKALILTTSTANMRLAIVTISGTVPTVNTPVDKSISGLSATVQNSTYAIKISPTKALVWLAINNTSSMVGLAITISGTTLSAVQFGTAGNISNSNCNSLTCIGSFMTGTDTNHMFVMSTSSTTKNLWGIIWKVSSSGDILGSTSLNLGTHGSTSPTIPCPNQTTLAYCQSTSNIVLYLVAQDSWHYAQSYSFDSLSFTFKRSDGASDNFFTNQCKLTNDTGTKLGACQISDSLALVIYYNFNAPQKAMIGFHNHGVYGEDMIYGKAAGIVSGIYIGNNYIMAKGLYTSSSSYLTGNLTAGGLAYMDYTNGALTATTTNNYKIGRLLGDRNIVIGSNFIFTT
jgi:hypothetical protein